MPKDPKDSDFLKKVRDRYRKAADYWKPIQDEAATDMRYVTGDPWSDRDKEARRQAGRPALTSDQLQQFTNQAINQLRQNKRGIKVQPRGEGSNDQTATVNQDIIRSIEYNSNAQQNAYIPAFENEINRSYGFFQLTRRYIGETFKQEILIKGIPNPDCVLFDPEVKEADWSDASYVFKLHPISREEYERKYPDASLLGFPASNDDLTSDWVQEKTVLTAEYWEVEKQTRIKLLLDTPEGELEVWQDELPEKKAPKEGVIRSRKVETKSVTQYIVNGVQILEENPQPGTIIPIFATIGKELWLPEGGKNTRKLMSLIRLARDPYMMFCWVITQEAEDFKQLPKSPVIGYVGQFKTDKEAWDSASDVPHEYLQVDAITDVTGQNTLPLPQIQQRAPNAQAYEVAADACIRRIQAAMGITPLPTAAARRNEKSGVALEKIEQQEQIGSFHFTDNFDRALALCGKVLLEWIPEVYNDEREMQVPGEDGKIRMVRINTDEPYMGNSGKPEQYNVAEELDHSVTISTGPSYQSQRDAVQQFLENLVSQLATLPLDPMQKQKVLALAVKMMDLGVEGDAIAEVISPDDPNSPQLYQQKLQQTQQQMAQMNAYAQQLEAEIQKLNLEKQGKVIDNEYKARIEELKIQAQITVAEIETKAQAASERMKWEHEAWIEMHGSAHETALATQQQSHDQDMAQQQAEQAQLSQASDQQHQAEMAQSSQPSDTGE